MYFFTSPRVTAFHRRTAQLFRSSSISILPSVASDIVVVVCVAYKQFAAFYILHFAILILILISVAVGAGVAASCHFCRVCVVVPLLIVISVTQDKTPSSCPILVPHPHAPSS